MDAAKSSHSPLLSKLPPKALPPSTKESIHGSLTTLRTSFRQGKLRPLENRKRVLKQIQTLLTEGQAQLEEAFLEDLHKHPLELYSGEIALVLAEIQEHLDYLDDWAAPQKVSTNVVNLPGSSAIVSDPLGVCCIIDTWNYPVQLLFVPLVGCIGAGNCALLRLPPEGTCDNIAAVMASLIDQYLDSDVVQYVVGGIDANIAMLEEKFDLIFVTGGTTIGKIVTRAAAETLTPVVLELGGKSPCIVDSNVDLQVAASRVAWGAVYNSGQVCLRPDYLFVHSKVATEFVGLLIERIKSFFGPNPQSSDSYGRIVNATQVARLAAIIDADRPYVVHGGDVDASSRYIAPTLLNFKSDMRAFEASAAMQGELFGPILPIVYYDNVQDAIDFVNARPKPLALYVFSNNQKDVVQPLLNQTSSGGVCVNDVTVQMTNSDLPFGGVGNSGMGAYHGHHSFRTFSHQKAVMYKSTMGDIPFRYMPYTPTSAKVLKLAMAPISRVQKRMAYVAAFVAFAAIVAGVVYAALNFPMCLVLPKTLGKCHYLAAVCATVNDGIIAVLEKHVHTNHTSLRGRLYSISVVCSSANE
ncbi:Aste57867_3377 [Aphanomyces stellatus]|uniref:Aste57867_3377 protein n=1 Tax=Aphanomyces stellatus TaxID=120398 RepID=A0A485K9I4_9STRA|nr:hypothetical protein As57867_003367 [Aphanomyces stellatus]VFT80543.1 Aste57867_3377 [Aphanomyces stellatus]